MHLEVYRGIKRYIEEYRDIMRHIKVYRGMLRNIEEHRGICVYPNFLGIYAMVIAMNLTPTAPSRTLKGNFTAMRNSPFSSMIYQ